VRSVDLRTADANMADMVYRGVCASALAVYL